MKNLRFSIAGFILLLCFAPALMAQGTLTPAKEKNIRKLLAITDASGIFKRSLESQIGMMRKTATQVPSNYWDELLKEVDADKFIELLIPIYDKHFSNEEVEGIIAFYETPVGRKLMSTLPEVMEESGTAGAKYGQEIAAKVIKKMQAEGTLKSSPKP